MVPGVRTSRHSSAPESSGPSNQDNYSYEAFLTADQAAEAGGPADTPILTNQDWVLEPDFAPSRGVIHAHSSIRGEVNESN